MRSLPGVLAVLLLAPCSLRGEDSPTLSDFLGVNIDQQYDLEFRAGDLVADSLFDFSFWPDAGSYVLSLGYRRYFESASLKEPPAYRKEPSFWLTGGLGEWDILANYDLYRGGGGVSLALGRSALLETEALYTRIEGFNPLRDVVVARTGLALFAAGNFSFRVGWIFNRYASAAGSGGNHSSIQVGAGYLWGSLERGLDLSFTYRSRGENGSSKETEYIIFGLNWYPFPLLAVGAVYEDISGDLEPEGHAVDVTVTLRPQKEFQVTGGFRTHHLDGPNKDWNSFFARVSYAF